MMTATFGQSATPADPPAGFLAIGDKIASAEQRVWAAYRKLMIISRATNDAGLPSSVIDAYEITRQSAIDAAMLLINERNKSPDVPRENPILPPSLRIAAAPVQGLAGYRRRNGLGAIIPAKDILVTFEGKTTNLADPLAAEIGYERDFSNAGLGAAPLVIVWILLGVGFTMAMAALLVHELRREQVEQIRTVGEQTKIQADNLDRAIASLETLVSQCVSKGGDPVKCLDKGEKAIQNTLKNLPKPPKLPGQGFTFFEVIGISALVAGVVIGGVAIWRRREQISTIIMQPPASGKAVSGASGVTFKRVRPIR